MQGDPVTRLRWKYKDGVWTTQRGSYVFLISSLLLDYYLDMQVVNGEEVLREVTLGRHHRVTEAKDAANELLEYLRETP